MDNELQTQLSELETLLSNKVSYKDNIEGISNKLEKMINVLMQVDSLNDSTKSMDIRSLFEKSGGINMLIRILQFPPYPIDSLHIQAITLSHMLMQSKDLVRHMVVADYLKILSKMVQMNTGELLIEKSLLLLANFAQDSYAREAMWKQDLITVLIPLYTFYITNPKILANLAYAVSGYVQNLPWTFDTSSPLIVMIFYLSCNHEEDEIVSYALECLYQLAKNTCESHPTLIDMGLGVTLIHKMLSKVENRVENQTFPKIFSIQWKLMDIFLKSSGDVVLYMLQSGTIEVLNGVMICGDSETLCEALGVLDTICSGSVYIGLLWRYQIIKRVVLMCLSDDANVSKSSILVLCNLLTNASEIDVFKTIKTEKFIDGMVKNLQSIDPLLCMSAIHQVCTKFPKVCAELKKSSIPSMVLTLTESKNDEIKDYATKIHVGSFK